MSQNRDRPNRSQILRQADLFRSNFLEARFGLRFCLPRSSSGNTRLRILTKFRTWPVPVLHVTISVMNWEQMKKNVGARVQLKPIPHRLDDYGRKLPSLDDDWIIEEASADGVRIRNVRTHHTTTLGKDHIYDYISNPDQSNGGVKHGFLTLKVQIFLKPQGLSITPTARPGESVEPPTVEIVEKWVSADYPARSGLKAQLEAAGYSVASAWDTKLAELGLKGGK